jgi:hypothetical protein
VPTAGDGIGVQSQSLGHLLISAVPTLEAFQAGIQSALLLIEQTVEQNNSRLEFLLL